MAQDVTDDLRRRAEIDLPGGVAVAENMSAENRSGHAGSPRVLADGEPNRRRGYRSVGNADGKEQDARPRVSGSTTANVVQQRSTNLWEQRQYDAHTGLRSSEMQRRGFPIDIVEPKRSDLRGTHAVGRHEKQHRSIATAIPQSGCRLRPGYVERRPREGLVVADRVVARVGQRLHWQDRCVGDPSW